MTGYRCSRSACAGIRRSLAALLFLCAVLAPPAPAFAQAAPSRIMNELCSSDSNGFVGIIIPCVENIVTETAYGFIDTVFGEMSLIYYAMLTLAVIFFGVKAMYGIVEANKLAPEAVMLAIKIGAVVFLTDNMRWVFDSAVGLLHGAMETISTVGVFSGGLQCPTGVGIGERMDCVLNALIGVFPPGQHQLSSGMMGFFFYNLFSGAMMALAGMLGLWMSITLVMAFFKAAMTYLIAFTMLAFLAVMGVVFAPFILFGVVDYFRKWMRMMIAMILQPIILFAYVNVLLSAFDVVLFSGEHSVRHVFMGEAAGEEDGNIHAYLKNAAAGKLLTDKKIGPIQDTSMTQFDTGREGPASGLIKSYVTSAAEKGTEAYKNAFASKDISQIKVGWPVKAIDYKEAAKALGREENEAPALQSEVLGSIVTAALVAYVFFMLLEYIPSIAQDLSRGGGSDGTPSIGGVGSTIPILSQMGDAAGGLAKHAKKSVAQLVGGR